MPNPTPPYCKSGQTARWSEGVRAVFARYWGARVFAAALIFIGPVAVAGPTEIPTNARLLITGTNQASVMWMDNSTGETGFDIQRRPDTSSTWTTVQSPAANATSWTDTAVPANTHVYYRVRSKNGTTPSGWSNTARLTNPGDSDADGIPDTAEITAGLDPSDWTDATADMDGDGVPNLWEYVLSTNMASAASKPTPTVTVDPNVAESTTVKRNITDAINYLTPLSAGSVYHVIVVKPGLYEENISLPTARKIALISDGSGVPPEIRGYSPWGNRDQTVEVLGDAVIDGFRISRKAGDGGFGMKVAPTTHRGMVRVVNCAIYGHQLPTGQGTGTGIQQGIGRLIVSHSTIYGNTRNGGQGAALYSNMSNPEQHAIAINSIFWNTASGTTSEIFSNGTATVVNSIVRNGSAWGAITSDPLLDPKGYLTVGSPAIGAGAAGHGAPWDVDVEARDANPDIGFDEYLDADADGIADRYESGGDLLPGNDDDGDGLTNLAEASTYGTSPIAADSDGDGLDDGDELTAGTNQQITDSDDDGMPDGYEVTHGLNPLSIWDRLGDADGDRIPNIWEYKRGTSPSNAASKPATDYIVSPSQAGTGIYRATIPDAINSISSTSGIYAIIEVRPGVYPAAVVTASNRKILLLADQQAEPVEIRAPSGVMALTLAGEAVADGFRISRPFTADDYSWPGVKIDANYESTTLHRAQTKLVNCVIQGHSYTTGGGVMMTSGRLTVEHCTIAGNSASTSGSGIYVANNTLNLVNSIVWNPAIPASSEVYKTATGQVIVTNSIIRGGEHGASGADPLLNPRGLLTASSPALNAGASGYANSDSQGESRSGAPDLGADEFIDTDSDGLPNWVEAMGGGVNPTDDTDSDGLNNLTEYATYATYAHIADTDGDGLSDGGEATASSNPFNADSDLDVMPDGYEVLHGLDPLDYRDALSDKDGDRIPNVYEWANGTSASSAASFPAPHFTVDPSAIGAPTNVKNTIKGAVDAANSGAHYKIIFVKSGVYPETINLSVGARAMLILGEKGFMPPRLAPTTGQYFVVLSQQHSVLDGFDILCGPSLTGTTGVFSGSVYSRVANCRIRGHRAGIGPAIYLSGSEMQVVNCLIHGNESTALPSSSTKHSGIYVSGAKGKLHLINSIVWNEKNSATVPQIYVASAAVQVDNSIVLGGQFGATNVNPLFDPVYGMLRSTSPAINAGSPALVGALATDFQNEPRGSNPDIGFDEFVDTDSDGLPDAWEQHFYSSLVYTGTDDTDEDGLTNLHEFRTGCDPTDADTDNDGITDFFDQLASAAPGDFADTDSDGLADDWERYYFGSLTRSGTDDTDGDGLTNAQELQANSDPADYYNGDTPQLSLQSGDDQNVDAGTVSGQPMVVLVRDSLGNLLENAPVTFAVSGGSASLGLSEESIAWIGSVEARSNAQGLASVWLKAGTNLGEVAILASADEVEVNFTATVVAPDLDADGIPDAWEIEYDLDPDDPADAALDPDSDVLTNLQEYLAGTDPNMADTDDDGYSDGLEVASHTDPLDPDNFPELVPDPEGKRISAGLGRTFSIRADGTVWRIDSFAATGLNIQQISFPATAISVAVSDGYETLYAVALDESGQVWDIFPSPATQVTGASDVVDVAAGDLGVYAVKSNGSVVHWDQWSPTPAAVPSLSGVKSVATTYYSAIFLKTNGTVVVRNPQNGTFAPVSGINDAVAVAVSGGSYLALRANGTVLAWGGNSWGELGNGGSNSSATPSPVPGLSNVKKVSGGSAHFMALTSDGSVWTWGRNHFGQLGTGDTTERRSPIKVSGSNSFVDIDAAAGFEYLDHSVAVKSDGSVWGWGYGISGFGGPRFINYLPDNELVTTLFSDIVHLQLTANEVVALRSDGTLWAWGWSAAYYYGDSARFNSLPARLNNLEDIVSFSVSSDSEDDFVGHFLAVKSDGSLWGFDAESSWYFGTIPDRETPFQITDVTNVKEASAGNQHMVIVKHDGTVWIRGYDQTPAIQLSGPNDVVSVRAAYGSWSIALTAGGSVWAWDPLGSPVQIQGLENIVAIDCRKQAGISGVVALKADGTVWKVQSVNSASVVSNLSDVVDVSAYGFALKSDGTVWKWTPTVAQIVGIEGGKAVFEALALKEDGTIYTWNQYQFGSGPIHGALGEGLGGPTKSPVPLLGFHNVHAPPQVTISSPVGTPSVALGQTQTITATFMPGSGSASTVYFYHHGRLLGQDDTAPFTFDFVPPTWGKFKINAVGVDSNSAYSVPSAPLTINVPYDSDTDNLPDWWELQYLGNLEGVGNGDSDHDGLTNLYEYAHGSNPVEFDYAQAPDILVVAGDGQRAAKGEEFSQALKVQVKNGVTPIPYGPVTFHVEEGSALLRSNGGTEWDESVTVVADAEGYAEAWLLAGQTLGPVRVTAVAGTAEVEIHATVSEMTDSPSSPWLPGGGYIIGDQTRTGSVNFVPTSETWTVTTTAFGFTGAGESVYWLPTQIGRSGVLEWTPDVSALEEGGLSGIMMRLSDENTADQPFVFVGVKKATSTPLAYAVELAWRSEENGSLRHIANLDLPGGAFTEGMRFRLQLVGGRLLLSSARPISPGLVLEPWKQRMAIELGEEELWSGTDAPLVFGGMAFSSDATGSIRTFSVSSGDLQIRLDDGGIRWWRVAEPRDLLTDAAEPMRLGMQNLQTEFSSTGVDVDLINPGSSPTSSEIWNADYWKGTVTGSSPMVKSLELGGIIHPTPHEYVDVYMRICGVDTDSARPALSIESNSKVITLASAPEVGGGSAENDTWVYVGRLDGESSSYTALTREIDCVLTWTLAGSLSQFTFDGFLFVGGSTQGDANENSVPDRKDLAGLSTRGGDWDGDGWGDAEEFMIGSNPFVAAPGVDLPTITALPGPNPLYVARGHWSPGPMAVKVTYDSAGTKPVKGYGLDISFLNRVGDVGFAASRSELPQFSGFRGVTGDDGVFAAEVWASPVSLSRYSVQSFEASVGFAGEIGPSPVEFAVSTYENRAPQAINADGVTRGLAFTVPFAYSATGKSIAATGNWLATGDPLGYTTLGVPGPTAFLPSFGYFNLPAMGPAVIMWNWNPYDGGFWQPSQFLGPDSTAHTGFGNLIVINEHPDPVMGVSAIMAVTAGNRLYFYGLTPDGTVWRRWSRDGAAYSTMVLPSTPSSLAFHGRWLAVGNAASRGKVDMYYLDHVGTGESVLWLPPSAPKITVLPPTNTVSGDAFGTSVAFSETGNRLVVGAPSTLSPLNPTQTGLAEPSVYVYESAASPDYWSQVSPVLQNTISTPAGGQWSQWARFGQNVLAVGDQVIVGAPIADGGAATSSYGTLGQPQGSIASYKLESGAWVQTGLHNGPYFTFGNQLVRGDDWLYAAAATLDTYLLEGNVVSASSDPEDDISPLPAFVRSYRFNSSEQLVEEPGGELAMGTTEVEMPIAAQGNSLFAVRHENEVPPHIYGEFRWLPTLSRDLEENSLVASLGVEDLEWNNPAIFPFETMSLALTEPTSLWSILPNGGLWDLRMIDGDQLQASQSDMFWLGVKATDLAGETHTEFLGVKLNRDAAEAPEIESGRWINGNVVEIAWSYDAANPDSYMPEYASLTGSPSPPYSTTGVVSGGARVAQLEVTPGQDGVATRIRSQVDGVWSSYSDIFPVPYDTNNDGLPDWWEAQFGGSMSASADPDGDNLTNLDEFTKGTNPFAADTDGDGIPDDVDTSAVNRNNSATGVVVHTVLQP